MKWATLLALGAGLAYRQHRFEQQLTEEVRGILKEWATKNHKWGERLVKDVSKAMGAKNIT